MSLDELTTEVSNPIAQPLEPPEPGLFEIFWQVWGVGERLDDVKRVISDKTHVESLEVCEPGSTRQGSGAISAHAVPGEVELAQVLEAFAPGEQRDPIISELSDTQVEHFDLWNHIVFEQILEVVGAQAIPMQTQLTQPRKTSQAMGVFGEVLDRAT